MATFNIIVNCCVKVTTPSLKMETDPVRYTQDLRNEGGERNEIVLDAAKPFLSGIPRKSNETFSEQQVKTFSMLFTKIRTIFSAKI